MQSASTDDLVFDVVALISINSKAITLETGDIIALSSLIYPAPMRATGIGWAMAMGRGGQVVAPIVARQLLSGGGDASYMPLVMAAALMVAAVFVVLLGRYSGTSTYAPVMPTEPRVATH